MNTASQPAAAPPKMPPSPAATSRPVLAEGVSTQDAKADRDAALEAALVARVGAAIGRTGLWETLGTDWLRAPSINSRTSSSKRFAPRALAMHASLDASSKQQSSTKPYGCRLASARSAATMSTC